MGLRRRKMRMIAEEEHNLLLQSYKEFTAIKETFYVKWPGTDHADITMTTLDLVAMECATLHKRKNENINKEN